jgi:hypothetical protein
MINDMEFSSYLEFKNNKNKIKKNISRKTGFKGVHIHYDHKRENLSFRATLKINSKEVLGYKDFEYSIKGLFGALYHRETFILNYNKSCLKPLKTVLKEEDIQNIINALKDNNFYILNDIYLKYINKSFNESLDLEKIEKEIKNEI